MAAKRAPEETIDFAALLGEFDAPAFVPARSAETAAASPPERPAPRSPPAREHNSEVRELEPESRRSEVSKEEVSKAEVSPEGLDETRPATRLATTALASREIAKDAPPAPSPSAVPVTEVKAALEASPLDPEAASEAKASKPEIPKLTAAEPANPRFVGPSETERVAQAMAQLSAEGETSGASSSGPAASPAPSAIGAAVEEQPGMVPSEDEEPVELSLDEAFSAEEELAELDRQRREAMERQRGLDEARIRAHVERPVSARPAGHAMGGFGDSDFGRGFAGDRSQLKPGTSIVKTQTPVEALADRAATPRSSAPEASRAPTRARQALQAAVERLKEMHRGRQLDSGRLALTIRLDDVTQVKLTINPRGDGSHELAFLVADPRLRDELQRSLPEIRNAATELPIDVAEVLIGELDELDPGDESRQRDTAGEIV